MDEEFGGWGLFCGLGLGLGGRFGLWVQLSRSLKGQG